MLTDRQKKIISDCYKIRASALLKALVFLGLVSLVVLFYFIAVFPADIGRGFKDATDLLYFVLANGILGIIGFLPTAYFWISYSKIKSLIRRLPDFQVETITGIPEIKERHYSFPIYGGGGRRLGGSTRLMGRVGKINGLKCNFWAVPDSDISDQPISVTAITHKSFWLGCGLNRFVIEAHPLFIFDGKAKEPIRKSSCYIMTHYALLIQYAQGGLEGEELKTALAHFSCVLAAVTPYWWHIRFRDSFFINLFCGKDKPSLDDVMALDEERFPDYPILFAEECVSKGDPNEYAEAIRLCLPSGDKDLEVAWNFALQQAAKSQGKLKEILERARRSPALKALPEVFAFINELHSDELLEGYRHGELCPDCKWEMACLAAIATMPAGDEIEDFYFQCENCNQCLVKHYHERFIDGETDIYYSKISEENAKRDVERIKKCPAPRDKHCDCETHHQWWR